MYVVSHRESCQIINSCLNTCKLSHGLPQSQREHYYWISEASITLDLIVNTVLKYGPLS